MDEPPPAPDEVTPQGFTCPGPLYLPGLLTIIAAHIGVLLAAMLRVRESGESGPLLGAAGALAGFWLVFFLIAWWTDHRTAVNLLGLAAVVLFYLGLVVGAVWWVVQLV